MSDSITLCLPRGFALRLVSGHRGYTVATIDPPIPPDLAGRLADLRHPPLPRYGSDRPSERVGEGIRAHGHGRGLSAAELATYAGGADVEQWHVDSPEGVGVLVAWLYEALPEWGLDAAEARKRHRTRKVDLWMLEAALRVLEGRSLPAFVKRMIVDGDADRDLDAEDPRWVALKARLRAELEGDRG